MGAMSLSDSRKVTDAQWHNWVQAFGTQEANYIAYKAARNRQDWEFALGWVESALETRCWSSASQHQWWLYRRRLMKRKIAEQAA